MKHAFWLGIAAAVIVAGCAREKEEVVESQTYTYTCGKGGPVGTVTFVQSDPEVVLISSGGETYELEQVPAASGAQYRHPTEDYMVWNQGDEMTFHAPGSSVDYTCSLDPAG
jgi:membrane-bound inhibitor of C-type lysozyme